MTTPRVSTRVDVHMFAEDLLAQRPPIVFESYPGTDDRGGLRLEDGNGVKIAISGDRSSLRLLVSDALAQLAPPAPDPPAERPLERHDEPPADPGTDHAGQTT